MWKTSTPVTRWKADAHRDDDRIAARLRPHQRDGIRYSALPGHTTELAEALNQELSGKWSKLRGIEIVSLGVSGVKASEEDEQMIKELQRSAAFMDPTRAAAHMVGAQASAMQQRLPIPPPVRPWPLWA